MRLTDCSICTANNTTLHLTANNTTLHLKVFDCSDGFGNNRFVAHLSTSRSSPIFFAIGHTGLEAVRALRDAVTLVCGDITALLNNVAADVATGTQTAE